MNVAFTKVLKIKDRLWEFNFRKLPSTYENFHVDVTDEKGRRILFSMYKSPEGIWRANAPHLPMWIGQAENVLGNVIDEHIQ
jgi:hypothetical protein